MRHAIQEFGPLATFCLMGGGAIWPLPENTFDSSLMELALCALTVPMMHLGQGQGSILTRPVQACVAYVRLRNKKQTA